MNGTKLYQRIAIVPIVTLGLAVAGCNKQAGNGTVTTTYPYYNHKYFNNDYTKEYYS